METPFDEEIQNLQSKKEEIEKELRSMKHQRKEYIATMMNTFWKRSKLC